MARANSGVRKPESTPPNAFDGVKALETKKGRILSEIIGSVQALIREQDFRSLHLRAGDCGVWLKPGKYIPKRARWGRPRKLADQDTATVPGQILSGLELLWDGQALPVKRIPV